jgi:acetyl-CoA acetyltransferase
MAGLKPTDMDTVQIYDAFTVNTVLLLEDMGFCEKGEGKDFVSGGRIAPGGALPVNTNGGGLSCVHPGMYGMFPMIEAIRQTRGDAPGKQIEDVTVSLAHGNGGVLSSQCTTIWGSVDTL